MNTLTRFPARPMRPKTRSAAAFFTTAFDALIRALDAEMYEHAACQYAFRLGLGENGAIAGFSAKFVCAAMWCIPIVGNFYNRGMKKWSF
jgi:hypothetical protein